MQALSYDSNIYFACGQLSVKLTKHRHGLSERNDLKPQSASHCNLRSSIFGGMLCHSTLDLPPVEIIQTTATSAMGIIF